MFSFFPFIFLLFFPVFRICLVMYGSLPSSGVMDGVRKSLGIGLYGYSFGRLVVSPLTIPSSLVKCPNIVSFLLLLLRV